jgi:hypothetical protein
MLMDVLWIITRTIKRKADSSGEGGRTRREESGRGAKKRVRTGERTIQNTRTRASYRLNTHTDTDTRIQKALHVIRFATGRVFHRNSDSAGWGGARG